MLCYCGALGWGWSESLAVAKQRAENPLNVCEAVQCCLYLVITELNGHTVNVHQFLLVSQNQDLLAIQQGLLI